MKRAIPEAAILMITDIAGEKLYQDKLAKQK